MKLPLVGDLSSGENMHRHASPQSLEEAQEILPARLTLSEELLRKN